MTEVETGQSSVAVKTVKEGTKCAPRHAVVTETQVFEFARERGAGGGREMEVVVTMGRGWGAE